MFVHARLLRCAACASLGAVLAASPFAVAQVADPLKPEGVTLGMPLAQADTVLTSFGYQKRRDCVYAKRDGEVLASVILRTQASRCTADGTVGQITFERHGEGAIDGTPPEVIGRMNKSIGGEPSCSALTDRAASCRWVSPSGAPHIGSLHTMASPQLLRLALRSPKEGERPASATNSSAGAAAARPSPPAQTPEDVRVVASPKKNVDNSTEGLELVNRSSAPPQEGRLDIEGVRLGMTGAEVTDVLRPKGWVSNVDSMNEQTRVFWESKGGLPPPEGFKLDTAPGAPAISLRYAYPPNVAAADRPVNEIRFEIRSKADRAATDAAIQEVFAAYVARHGEPDACKSRPHRTNYSCTWTRKAEGGEETLHWLRSSVRPSLTLKAGPGPAAAAADPSPPAQTSNAASTPSARTGLAVEGVFLGMLRQEVMDALLRAGYEEQRSDALWFSRYEPGRIKQDRIQMTYDGDGGVSSVQGAVNNAAGYDQRRQELVARWGPPDSCTAPGKPAEGWMAEVVRKHGGREGTMIPNCTWTREEQGQQQRLHVTFEKEMDRYALSQTR